MRRRAVLACGRRWRGGRRRPPRAPIQTVTIGDLYDGGTVNLAPGDTLEVRLSARPDRLRLGQAFDDAAILKPEARRAGRSGLPLPGRDGGDRRASGSRAASPRTRRRRPAGLFRVLVVVKDSVAAARLPPRGARQRLRHLPRPGRRHPGAVARPTRRPATRGPIAVERALGAAARGRTEVRAGRQAQARRGRDADLRLPGRRAAAGSFSSSSIARPPRRTRRPRGAGASSSPPRPPARRAVRLHFYGTKGYVPESSREHAGHSAFVLEAEGLSPPVRLRRQPQGDARRRSARTRSSFRTRTPTTPGACGRARASRCTPRRSPTNCSRSCRSWTASRSRRASPSRSARSG